MEEGKYTKLLGLLQCDDFAVLLSLGEVIGVQDLDERSVLLHWFLF